MTSKTVSVRLDQDTLEHLGVLATIMNRPKAWLMAHDKPYLPRHHRFDSPAQSRPWNTITLTSCYFPIQRWWPICCAALCGRDGSSNRIFPPWNR